MSDLNRKVIGNGYALFSACVNVPELSPQFLDTQLALLRTQGLNAEEFLAGCTQHALREKFFPATSEIVASAMMYRSLRSTAGRELLAELERNVVAVVRKHDPDLARRIQTETYNADFFAKVAFHGFGAGIAEAFRAAGRTPPLLPSTYGAEPVFRLVEMVPSDYTGGIGKPRLELTGWDGGKPVAEVREARRLQLEAAEARRERDLAIAEANRKREEEKREAKRREGQAMPVPAPDWVHPNSRAGRRLAVYRKRHGPRPISEDLS